MFKLNKFFFHRSLNDTIIIIILSAVILLLPVVESGMIAVPGLTSNVGYILIALWFLNFILHPRLRFSKSALFLLLFFLIEVLSLLWSVDSSVTTSRIMLMIKNIAFYIIIINVVRDGSASYFVVAAQVLGIAIASVSMISNIAAGASYANAFGRYSAEGFDPNNFGVMIASTLPLITFFFRNIPALGLTIISFFSILLIATGSRSALIALGFAIIYVLLVNLSSIKRFTLFMGSILIGVFSLKEYIIRQIPTDSIQRVINSLESDFSNGRVDIISDSFSYIDQKLLFGWGSGTFSTVNGMNAHNSIISNLFEIGILGLTIWVSLWIIHLLYGIKIIRVLGVRSLGGAVAFSLLCISVSNLTLNWEARSLTYIAMAILASTYMNLPKGIKNEVNA